MLSWLRHLTSRKVSVSERPFVKIDGAQIILGREGGVDIETVNLSEVEAFEYVTTSDGPWFDDVFVVVTRVDGIFGLMVASTAVGFEGLMDYIATLPGYNDQAALQAMGCTEDSRFLAWARSPDVSARYQDDTA